MNHDEILALGLQLLQDGKISSLDDIAKLDNVITRNEERRYQLVKDGSMSLQGSPSNNGISDAPLR
jgi:hypothetical protein